MSNKYNSLSIIEYVLDEKYWKYIPETIHYTKHSNNYYNDDTSCDNCKNIGTRKCDICDPMKEDAHFECFINQEDLYKMLINKGIDKDTANYLSNDNHFEHLDGYILESNESWYIFNWPNEYQLKERYKDFYDKLYNNIKNA